MNNKEIIVGLDVGTTKVCTIVGQRNLNNEIEIIGVGTNPSDGLKKGSVVNIDKTIKSIKTSVDEAKLMAGVEIDSASIGIAGSHIYSFDSTYRIEFKKCICQYALHDVCFLKSCLYRKLSSPAY